MTSWANNTADIKACLDSLSIHDASATPLEPEDGFLHLRDLTLQIKTAGNTVFFIGNGASASMASHFSADLAKNAHLRTEVFTDLALITALANDISYEEVFAEPLRRRMQKGDLLVAISSSGESPNILRAAQTARSLGGVVVTLSAMAPGNSLRTLGTLNFYIPAKSYGLAETGHAAILHHWVDLLVALAK